MDVDEMSCREIGRLLRELAQQRCRGELGAEGFVRSVLRLETELVRPAGLVLSAVDLNDDWMLFSIYISGGSEPCASFEFCPVRGEFREALLERPRGAEHPRA